MYDMTTVDASWWLLAVDSLAEFPQTLRNLLKLHQQWDLLGVCQNECQGTWTLSSGHKSPHLPEHH